MLHACKEIKLKKIRETRSSYILTRVYGIFTRHESRAGRCTNGIDIVTIQYETRICQGIDVGRGNLRWSTKANIVETLNNMKARKERGNRKGNSKSELKLLVMLTYQIIRQNEDDVRLSFCIRWLTYTDDGDDDDEHDVQQQQIHSNRGWLQESCLHCFCFACELQHGTLVEEEERIAYRLRSS